MVNTSELHRLDDVILQIFEDHDELFHFPVTTQQEARAFVKALHGKGIAYTSLSTEVAEPETNFTSWRKGLGRTGIGNRVMERINKPLQEILLSDAEDDYDDVENEQSSGGDPPSRINSDGSEQAGSFDKHPSESESTNDERSPINGGGGFGSVGAAEGDHVAKELSARSQCNQSVALSADSFSLLESREKVSCAESDVILSETSEAVKSADSAIKGTQEQSLVKTAAVKTAAASGDSDKLMGSVKRGEVAGNIHAAGLSESHELELAKANQTGLVGHSQVSVERSIASDKTVTSPPVANIHVEPEKSKSTPSAITADDRVKVGSIAPSVLKDGIADGIKNGVKDGNKDGVRDDAKASGQAKVPAGTNDVVVKEIRNVESGAPSGNVDKKQTVGISASELDKRETSDKSTDKTRPLDQTAGQTLATNKATNGDKEIVTPNVSSVETSAAVVVNKTVLSGSDEKRKIDTELVVDKALDKKVVSAHEGNQLPALHTVKRSNKAIETKAAVVEAGTGLIKQTDATITKADKVNPSLHDVDASTTDKFVADKTEIQKADANTAKPDKALSNQADEKTVNKGSEKEEAGNKKQDIANTTKATEGEGEKENIAKADSLETETAKTEKEKSEKAKRDKAEADKVEADKERATKPKAAAVKAEAEKAEAAKAKSEAVKAEAEKAEAAKAKAEAVKAEADKAEAAKAKAEAAKAEADKAEAAKAKAEAVKVEVDKARANKEKEDKMKRDKGIADKAIADKADKAKFDKAVADKAKADKAEAVKTLADKVKNEEAMSEASKSCSSDTNAELPNIADEPIVKSRNINQAMISAGDIACSIVIDKPIVRSTDAIQASTVQSNDASNVANGNSIVTSITDKPAAVGTKIAPSGGASESKGNGFIDNNISNEILKKESAEKAERDCHALTNTSKNGVGARSEQPVKNGTVAASDLAIASADTQTTAEFACSATHVDNEHDSDSDAIEKVSENYSSDLDIENSELTLPEKERIRRIKSLPRVPQTDGVGYVYAFTDSANDSKKHRIKVSTSRQPYKRLQQATLFNVDMKLVSAVHVGERRKALLDILDQLKQYAIVDTEDWFLGPLDDVLQIMMETSQNYPHKTG